jgi:hypothetical protein
MCKKYSEKELENNINLFDQWDWRWISSYQNLSEEFIEKYSYKVDWINISLSQKLSEEFIKKNINKINIFSLVCNEDISKKTKEEIKTLKEII